MRSISLGVRLRTLARETVRNAIKNGNLKKDPCEECGKLKAHAHHDDYSKPLNVRWLCALCRARYHKMKRESNAI
jgi:hypothetical protein